jgi:deazaflavin-dependent oxidoreductase (nitroreductase family)
MGGWNEQIIAEFREHGGKVGGRYERQPLLLLHHTGAKSGVERINPLAYQRLGDDAVAVFGTKGGAPTDPQWYRNLLANPRARVEIGTETFDVVARVAEGEERERIWEKQKQLNPNFEVYEHKTGRLIPIVILERVQPD